MDAFLKLSPVDRAQAFDQAAAARGLSPSSVEKDFWVCLVLRELFALPEHGEHLTFKGGTSLSKAWGLIERLSEDIDLTIDRDYLGFGADRSPEASSSGNEQQRRLKKLMQACGDLILREILPTLRVSFAAVISANEHWTLLPDDGDDGLTMLFSYPRFGPRTAPIYLTPVVRLEFGARSDPWPVQTRQIVSIVAEEFPQLFDSPGCSVRALLPERTFWEKVMLLHEETFRPTDKPRRPRMARHYYDVWRLIEKGIASRAMRDVDLFERVAAHRRIYFRQNWVDYDTLDRRTIHLLPTPAQRPEWRRDYDAMRGEMLNDNAPPFDDIMKALEHFQMELNSG